MNNINSNNPNNDAYWQARGHKKRPKNWKESISKPSKRQIIRAKYHPFDGRGLVGSMLDPLCKDDY